MFNDGSVMHRWTGETQKEHAQDAAAAILLEQFTYLEQRGLERGRADNITLCRMKPGGEWERCTP